MSTDSLPAGDFGGWLDGFEAALRGEADSDVPCGACTACCTSSQFVHVAPDETETLARIPKALRFPAPGLPRGHFVMGYDERGHCPMLVGGKCSIYEHRPRTCRTYDCRVFAAVGFEDDEKPDIATQARRWRFAGTSDPRFSAVRRAATFLRTRAGDLPPGTLPASLTRTAVLAVEIARRFADGEPTLAVVADAIARVKRAGTGKPA